MNTDAIHPDIKGVKQTSQKNPRSVGYEQYTQVCLRGKTERTPNFYLPRGCLETEREYSQFDENGATPGMWRHIEIQREAEGLKSMPKGQKRRDAKHEC